MCRGRSRTGSDELRCRSALQEGDPGVWRDAADGNVGPSPDLREARTEVMRAFLELGGGMVDSSPMYGSSEGVIGHSLRHIEDDGGLFSATKIWTRSARGGAGQTAESRLLRGLDRFDLMQVHNLLSSQDNLETMRQEREQGRIRYIGVTTSHGRRPRGSITCTGTWGPCMDPSPMLQCAVDRELAACHGLNARRRLYSDLVTLACSTSSG
ncbi:MAG: hypothetical protein EA347_06210 [Thioalkalivibrio sp.]|nr:MAG: hypothetical protein EA347_06210 [Thioalkalivibrio sp.]